MVENFAEKLSQQILVKQMQPNIAGVVILPTPNKRTYTMKNSEKLPYACIQVWSLLKWKTSWWFQPIWKILVKMGNFPTSPKYGLKFQDIWNHHLENFITPCIAKIGVSSIVAWMKSHESPRYWRLRSFQVHVDWRPQRPSSGFGSLPGGRWILVPGSSDIFGR